MRKSRGAPSQETRDKISKTKKLRGQRPDPSVVNLDKARRVRWSGHVKDLVGVLLGIYKGSAKTREVPFELTRDEFEMLINLACFYCGDLPAERTLTSHKQRIVCNGIDRVDNSKGYLRENCVPACKTCNVAKARLSQQAFITHCKKIASKHA